MCLSIEFTEEEGAPASSPPSLEPALDVYPLPWEGSVCYPVMYSLRILKIHKVLVVSMERGKSITDPCYFPSPLPGKMGGEGGGGGGGWWYQWRWNSEDGRANSEEEVLNIWDDLVEFSINLPLVESTLPLLSDRHHCFQTWEAMRVDRFLHAVVGYRVVESDWDVTIDDEPVQLLPPRIGGDVTLRSPSSKERGG